MVQIMQEKLFRSQALEHQKDRLHGQALVQPSVHSLVEPGGMVSTTIGAGDAVWDYIYS